MPLESIPREKVLAVIAKLGPVQPLDVRRELGEGDTMLIGAICSEMVASGLIAISRTKRGGSPFYYDPKHSETLERISQFLNEKDQRTYQLLRGRKVLNEREVEPLTRVSLGNIPDYSRRFLIGEEAWWRYYLVPEAEARELVQGKTKPPKPEKPQVAEAPKEPEKQKRLIDKPKHKRASEELLEDELYTKVLAFADKEGGSLSKQELVKPGELTCRMSSEGSFGEETFMVCAFARKTLPETFVWKALLEARSHGLPLLILKDSAFPKSLEKKFSDVENVYFKRV